MTKTVDTLVEDIYKFLEDENEISDELYEQFGRDMAAAFKKQMGPDRPAELSMSQMGDPDCKSWYKINKPEEAEELRGQTRLKFLFGDLTEALVLTLAKACGHKVEGEQTRLEIDGVYGSRDCIIDGVLIDVKSASSYSMNKFKDNGLYYNDPFGYLPQIETYFEASKEEDILTDKTRYGFLAFDKQHANMALDLYTARDNSVVSNVRRKQEMVQGDFPGRDFYDVEDGKSGNRKLDTQCSYCAFKEVCWPGVRTYIYSNGPRYLTKVVKEPKVDEKK